MGGQNFGGSGKGDFRKAHRILQASAAAPGVWKKDRGLA